MNTKEMICNICKIDLSNKSYCICDFKDGRCNHCSKEEYLCWTCHFDHPESRVRSWIIYRG